MSWSRFLTALLLAAVIALSYYLYVDQAPVNVQVAPTKEQAIFSGKGLSNTSYNSQGTRSYRIASASLEHFAESGETIFESPKLEIYRDGDTIEWRISATRAVLDDEQKLTLYDNVQMQNLLPEASFSTMATDQLVIELTSRDFYADQPVMLVGPLFETRGTAMKGNLKANNATLYDNVQGRYEIHTP